MKTNYPWAPAVNGIKRVFIGLVLAAGVMLTQPAMAVSPEPVDLGSCSNFAVLAGSGITVAGAVDSTTITGDIGTYPTPSITGLGNVVLHGTNHADDAFTQNAKNDLVAAYSNAAGRSATTSYGPIYDLGGLMLTSGVYNGSSSFGITGTLTLDAQGNPDAVWIFQAGSTLVTATNSIVALTNGAQASHVFWQVGSSATLGTYSIFKGTIMALESITMNTGSIMDGRALARNAAVSLDTDSISLPKSSQTITNFMPTNGSAFEMTNVVGLSAQASSGLLVSFAVTNGPGVITDGTNLAFASTGLVSIVASQAGDSNWNAAPTVTNTFNVTKAAATVTLSNLVQNYNGSARVVTATTVPPGLTVDITYDGNNWAPTNVGTYSVTGVVNAAMYEGSTTGTLVVSPLAVVLNGTRPYNGTATASNSILTVTNKVGMDVVTVASGSATLAGANVGSQAITNMGTLALGGAALANYTLAGASGSVEITSGNAITITADARSKTYGSGLELGTTNFTVAGVMIGLELVTNVILTANGGTNVADAAGGYTITPSAATGSGGFLAANYAITYATNTLTVNQRPVTLTGTRPYNGLATAFFDIPLTVTNAVGTDVVTVASGSATLAGANVGSQAITNMGTLALGGAALANYTLAGASGSVEITSGNAITITADARSKTYGSGLELGTTNFTVAGVMIGLELVTNVILTANGGTNAGDAAGGYIITPSAATGAGGFLAANYAITYATNTLTVNQRPVILTGTRSYNGLATAFFDIPLTVTNKVGADDVTGDSGSATLAGSNVGAQAISSMGTLALGGAALANYTLAGASGSVTITTGLLTLTLSDLAQTYNGAARIVTATTDPVGLTVDITYDVNAWAPTNAGSYAVTATINDGNYSGSMNRTLVVSKGNQTITNFTPVNGSAFATTCMVGLAAQASSGLAVTNFAVLSGPGVLDATLTNLTFTNSGSVSVTADQPGDNNWNAAPNVTNTFTVIPPLSADLIANDLVYLPVNVTNLTTAGTVSFRLGNIGPDTLNSAEVAFDFRIGNATAMVLLGSDQRAFNLAAGQEQLVILTAQAKRGLVVPASLIGVKQVQVTVRHASTLNDPNLANNTTTAAGTVLVRATGVNSPGRLVNDYDGDGKSDAALWHAGSNLWALCLSGQGYQSISKLNAVGGDLPVPGDYDGDGVTDMAIWCRLNSWWNVLLSSTQQALSAPFIGGSDFTAAQGDFDGDSMTDPAVYRSDGTWFVAASSAAYAIQTIFLGGSGHEPVVGDYDGDGLADPAVYNRTTGLWEFRLSGNDYQIVSGTFGGSGYLSVSADYDGDGLVDPAVYEAASGKWQVLMSGSEYALAQFFLQPSAFSLQPVPADYDGDGLADPAVYHQDTGLWELFPSSQGYELAWGLFGGPEFAPVME